MKHLVGYAQNNVDVYVDLVESKAAKQIARAPRLLSLAAEALQRIPLKKSSISLECNMGRIVGYDFVVETTAADNIFYVQLLRDDTYTRFTKNGKPTPTQHLSIMLRQNPTGSSYDLHDIWVGRLAPPKPGSLQETATSKTYWEKHACIFENQPIQSRTLTKMCPY